MQEPKKNSPRGVGMQLLWWSLQCPNQFDITVRVVGVLVQSGLKVPHMEGWGLSGTLQVLGSHKLSKVTCSGHREWPACQVIPNCLRFDCEAAGRLDCAVDLNSHSATVYMW